MYGGSVFRIFFCPATIGELGEVPSREAGLGCRSGYKEKREHTGGAIEIRVVARLDLGRTRRDATRRDASPVTCHVTSIFGYAVPPPLGTCDLSALFRSGFAGRDHPDGSDRQVFD